MKKRNDLSLVGKILSDHPQSFEVVNDTMMAAWRPQKMMEINKMGTNFFLFTFWDPVDRRRVLQGQPWLLSKLLVIIQEFDSEKRLGQICFNKSPFLGLSS